MKTFVSRGKAVRGKTLIPANTTSDMLCSTLTAKYEAIGINDIITLKHYPRTVILIKYGT